MQLGLSEYVEDRATRRARVQNMMVAAADGNVDAQIALAWHYVQSDFVALDLAAAGIWFERAAASGSEEAIVHRARFLQLRRVPQGNRDLRRLAASGNAKAQFWLAQHYESRGHRISRLKAVVWYDHSFRNGYRIARSAKFVLLAKLAPLLSKPIYAAAALRDLALRCLAAGSPRMDRYEALQYRLKPRG